VGDDRIRELIERIGGSGREAAWVDFLARYAPTIQRVIRRFERDPDRRSDCFVFVCEHLAANRSRRLRTFDADGPASFPTWLMAVVANLVLDWRRSVLGRHRPFSSIARLEPLEIEVYRLVVEGGASLHQAWASLRHEYRDLTLERVAGVVDELHARLTSRQHWLLATRRPQVRSIESLAEETEDPEASSPILASDEADPEARAERAEEHRHLVGAMASLSVEERLAIRLRFQEELTLREVGELMGLGDPFRARRLLDRAVAKLEESWRDSTTPEPRRKTPEAVRVEERGRKKGEPDD